MKHDMEMLLDKLGLDVDFQPFARLTDFNQGVRSDRPSFVFAPDWYLHSYGNALQLKPMLQAVRDHRQSYHKVLVSARYSHKDMQASERISLAMTSLGPDSVEILNIIFPDDEVVDLKKIRVVEVPKDVDAIFAAALTQVDVALVSQVSLQQFRAINPRLIDSLNVLGKSKSLDMPVLGYLEDSSTSEQLAIFRQFMISTGSSQVMRALRIDGWSEHNE
ncbi:MAG: PhnD/SsuA/transferrin family substrate-binding protein [Candidatus Thiodiazotropha sp. (ex Monitilora ramsayi)]|nr:PhnD/SsuA/transferrin family substrate-binding protein [Candidatus Thiodiazotropha sp. (ex Monitilora ramsayi)]